MNRIAAFALALFALPIAVVAQAQPPGVQRVEGTVTAVTTGSMTITGPDGKVTTVALLPGRNVNIVAPIDVSRIEPGSYVATANKTQPDGGGISTELRVYPPGTPRMNVNTAMNAEGDLMMTNGTVATAVSAQGGRVLTVDYGNGQRKITVPTAIQVISNTPAPPETVKVGMKLVVVTFPAQGERPGGQIITIDKKDIPAG